MSLDNNPTPKPTPLAPVTIFVIVIFKDVDRSATNGMDPGET